MHLWSCIRNVNRQVTLNLCFYIWWDLRGHVVHSGASGTVDVSYVAPQAHGIVNVALHWEYSSSIVFIFSQERKDLYHVYD
jgi:hypothetical protein